jgi:hypothetical protein
MNLDFTEDDVKQLTLLAAKLMANASVHNHSMAKIELDPQNLFNLSGKPGAGRLFIAVAGGPSISVLKTAIEIANNPH